MNEILIVSASVFGAAAVCSVIFYLLFYLKKRRIDKCKYCIHNEEGRCNGPNPNAPCEWKEKQPR